MQYDLIVVGGGPGGLMAAKTAAEDGLKVLVIERKRDLTKIGRNCAQIFYVRKRSPTTKGFLSDGYIEKVAVEYSFDTTKFIFPSPGFSLEYKGPLKPYYNWIDVSPSKHLIYSRRNVLWGFFFDKEIFLTELLAAAQNAGAEVWPQTMAIGAENTPDGVKVAVRGKNGEQTLEASRIIAADGMGSRIVESLGLNKKRQLLNSMQLVGYELEGVKTDLPVLSWVNFRIPSISRLRVIFFGLLAGDNTQLISSSEEILQTFMKHPTFAPWFHDARVVKKTAFVGNLRTPIKVPVEGNAVVVGDAGAPVETWIQGAVASAYMAVKAIEKELNGQKGYPGYVDWWQKAFFFNKPDYFRWVVKAFALSNACSDDEEVDHIFQLLQDINKETEGWPQVLIDENLELIKQRKPDFYEKLQQSYAMAEKMLLQGKS
jgi:flavin-dependent dehydrogenase